MKTRELDALLRCLRRHGVSSYTADGVSVSFDDISPEPVKAVDATPKSVDEGLVLPMGVFDPRAQLAAIHRAARERKS